MERDRLRPIERAVLRLADTGMPAAEIAWRFRRSPGHIERVLDLTRLPRRPAGEVETSSGPLRAVERRVLRARADGVDVTEIAARMRRSPDHVRRVEQYASYKLTQGAAS